MKKIALLLATLTITCGVFATTFVFGSSNNSASFLGAEGCQHVGYHYDYVAATSTTDGRQEYWKCCVCDETFLVEPAGSFLEGSLTYFGEPGMVIPAHEHYDFNGDDLCDEPGCKETDWVESVYLTIPTDYLGAGERTVLTANVDIHGSASNEVEWHIEKSDGYTWTKYPSDNVDTIFELIDNKDGTATLIGKDNVYKAEYSVYVYATSKENPNISSNKTQKIFYQTFNNTKRGTLNTFFGSGKWQTIPFFPSISVSIQNEQLVCKPSGTSSTRSFNQMVASFDNQGLWTRTYLGYSDATYTLMQDGYLYTCKIDDNGYYSGKNYGEFTISKSEIFDSFPSLEVEQILSDLGATGTVPAYDGGYGYYITQPESYYDTYKVNVISDHPAAALESYVATLLNDDFFVFQSSSGYNYYGLEGYTVVICPYVLDGNLVIEIDCSDKPIVKPITEWPADTVAAALGDLAEEVAVPATGSKFEIVSEGTHTISTDVYGSPDTYKSALLQANYVVESSSYYLETYKSSTDTITARIDSNYYDYYGYYNLTLTSHLPAGVYTYFPLEEVKAIIKGSEANDVVGANGTKFRLTKNDDYDVTIVVEGGNKTEFTQSLLNAGFTESFVAGSYYKGNLAADVTSSYDTYSINYYLLELPVNPLGFWSTFVGDTIENPYKINGPYGEFKLILSFNAGTFECWDKANKSYSKITLTGDLEGCQEGQLHLYGADEIWNCVYFDLIVEYSETTHLVTVVKNSSYSLDLD